MTAAAFGRQVLGAVLAGGASRRMGTDKALVEVAGTPLVARAAAALRAAGCHPVLVVGGDAARLAELGLGAVADRRPGEGPLDGIVRALEVADGSAAVVVACDMPELAPATITALIAALDASSSSLDVVVARSERLEPLCAAWAPHALPSLVEAFEDGERAVHRVLDGLRVGEVCVAADQVRNVNTPADLAEAVAFAERIGASGDEATG